MRTFELNVPDRGALPVLVEVPHAGLGVPEAVRPLLAAPEASLLRDADIYVDQLYDEAADAGATVLSARLSRYVVDLNRSADDVDRETVPDHPAPRALQPRGVVWRMTTDGRPALERPLSFAELQDRIDRFHAPYHRTLEAQIERLRSRFGFAVLVAGHSMPSASRSSRSGTPRADVVPGTRGRTTAASEVIDLVDEHFVSAGHSVRHDDPYRGGFTTANYGRPQEGVHAIQIELNRALYVDEETLAPKPAEFDKLRSLLTHLIKRLGELDLTS